MGKNLLPEEPYRSRLHSGRALLSKQANMKSQNLFFFVKMIDIKAKALSGNGLSK